MRPRLQSMLIFYVLTRKSYRSNGIAKFSALLLWKGIWLAVLVQYDMKGRIGYDERRGFGAKYVIAPY